MNLYSDGIRDGWIADRYGKRSDEVRNGVPLRSPPLAWDEVPQGTRSLALIMEDYDDIPDEGFCWIHWLVSDIDADRKGLPENASREDGRLIQGRNSWMAPFEPYGLEPDLTDHYGGPAPDRVHEYEFRLFALDRALGLKPGFHWNELRRAMEGHVLAQAVLRAKY